MPPFFIHNILSANGLSESCSCCSKKIEIVVIVDINFEMLQKFQKLIVISLFCL